MSSSKEGIVERLIHLYGDVDKAAKQINKDRLTLVGWRNKGFIPARLDSYIEEKTGGAITASEVRVAALHSAARTIS